MLAQIPMKAPGQNFHPFFRFKPLADAGEGGARIIFCCKSRARRIGYDGRAVTLYTTVRAAPLAYISVWQTPS